MAACYESPWTFLYWYLKPSDVKSDPALSFWDAIPTVFDESRALAEKGFDPETGIWWECPGYSVVVTLNDFTKFADRAKEALGIDLFTEIPVLRKDCDAAGEYLFPDGCLIGFGDTHPSPIPAGVLKYAKNLHSSPFFHAPNASWLVARSGMDATNDVAFALNASLGNHQHANGISLELYAKGYRLAPDAGVGWLLYGGDDYREYYSRFPAHNTVMVNSRSNYGIMKNNLPFTLLDHGDTWATVSFREPATGAEQQRTVRYVKDAVGAYFVDIFRSRVPQSAIRSAKTSEWHDYYYHNLGDSLDLGGDVKPTGIVNSGESGLPALNYLTDKFARVGTNDLAATFAWQRPEGNVGMRVFMNGGAGRDAAEFFWRTVMEHYLYAPGCVSVKESFRGPDRQGQFLTGLTGETCCTYNLLRLSRQLFEAEPRAAIADYQERALWNHILGQPEPIDGCVTYFLPVGTGTYKLQNRGNDCFWCCQASAMESHVKVGRLVFAEIRGRDCPDRADSSVIYVNQWIPAEFDNGRLRLRLETDFPRTEKATLRVLAGAGTVAIRRPFWTCRDPHASRISTNGEYRDDNFQQLLAGSMFRLGAAMGKVGKNDSAAMEQLELTSMRQHAEGLGGSLIVRSAPGHGATIAVRIPL